MVEIIGKSYSLTTIKKYCRLVGFFPYDLVRVGDKVFVKFSRKYLAWSYFLATSLRTTGVIYSFLTLKTWFSPKFLNELMVIHIVHLNFMFNILNAVVCIMYTTFNRMNLNEFINNIMKVDRLLDQLEIPINKNRWSKIVAVSIGIVYIIIIVADCTSYYLVFEEKIFWMHALRRFPYYCSYLFTLAQTYMFWSFVLLLKARLCAIKDALMDADDYWSKDNMIVQEFKSVLTLVKKSVNPDYKSVQKVYICLFDSAKALDRLVRPIIVLSFVTRFFALLITPFILYVQISGYRDNFFIFSQTLWALGQFSSLTLLVEPASSCRKEYDRLRQELSRLICQESILNGSLDLLYDLVKALPIEFYINDATPLKRTLYVSILGSLTTYLVVLFQMVRE